MVSHDRAFLDLCVDHILSLNKTGPLIEQGDYSSFAFNQGRRDAFDTERNERLGKEIAKLEESQRVKRAWSDKVEGTKLGAADRGHVGHMAAKAMKRAKSIQTRQQRMIDDRRELMGDIEYASDLKIETLPHDKRIFLTAEGLTLGYDGVAVVRGLDFQLLRGERLAIVGPNGCGKSTLIKAVLGQIAPMAGALRPAPRLVISYVRQETDGLRGDVRAYATAQGADLSRFLMLLRKLDFPRKEFERDMRAMSEGQKKKILIAASLCTPAHLYLWDEPLNFVDILSRIQIEDLIAQGDATMLLIEHDERFLDTIGARRLALGETGGGGGGDGGLRRPAL
jgi:lincosamide and streptogramin A transport system ATP-binding/permease protein